MKEREIICRLQVCNLNELSQDEQQLVVAAKEATKTAYAPYSKFYVGAALLLEDGTIVKGSNQENGAYPSGLCAERVALFYANAQHPQLKVKAMAISTAVGGVENDQLVSPCGACRQVILQSELRQEAPIRILMSTANEVTIVESIRSILPLGFELEEK